MGMSSSISQKNCWTTIIDTVNRPEFCGGPATDFARAVPCAAPIAGAGLSASVPIVALFPAAGMRVVPAAGFGRFFSICSLFSCKVSLSNGFSSQGLC